MKKTKSFVKPLLIILLTLFVVNSLQAQSTLLPVDYDYHISDRLIIKNPESGFQTTVKPWSRQQMTEFIDTISNTGTAVDRQNIRYLMQDNWTYFDDSLGTTQKPFLRHFYKNPADLYHVNTEDFQLHVRPVLYLTAGKESASDQFLFQNTRGIRVRGLIDNKVGFYSFIAENQARYPEYVRNYIDEYGAVPGQGYTKDFKTDAADFITARAHISVPVTSHIQATFGHGKNFIGDGYRSLILSDFSSNYTFLRLDTRIWKIHYVNLFAQLNSDIFYQNELLPKKHLAFHHLSVNLSPNFRIGLFESIILGRDNGAFDLNYLNPVIFYRSVEQQLGSEDNALLGLDLRWDFARHFSIYGQLVLDEFFLQHIREADGWWANKQAGQIGFKYIDVAGINNLDFQGEVNIVRPYMYSHRDKSTNYTHYNHPLAHPVGANFYEALGILRWQPVFPLTLTAKVFNIVHGADTDSLNYGGDPRESYDNRAHNFGNYIGRGNTTNTRYMSLNASYMLFHNFFIDLTTGIRTSDSQEGDSENIFGMLSIRWNMGQRTHVF